MKFFFCFQNSLTSSASDFDITTSHIYVFLVIFFVFPPMPLTKLLPPQPPTPLFFNLRFILHPLLLSSPLSHSPIIVDRSNQTLSLPGGVCVVLFFLIQYFKVPEGLSHAVYGFTTGTCLPCLIFYFIFN